MTFGFSLEAGAPDGFDFITGGFSVERTYETTSQFSCQASPQSTACVWSEPVCDLKLAYMLTAILRYQTVNTAYTVEMTATCGPGMGGTQSIMRAPNTDQSKPIAKQFYCVEGPCGEVGVGYWEANGPAGGPDVLIPAIALANSHNSLNLKPDAFVSEFYNDPNNAAKE